MTAKKRSILLSVLTLLLCLALFAVGTYAFFSAEVKLKNHLQAGTMDITLIRTHLLTESLNPETRILEKTENPRDIDFSKPADLNDPNAENKNVFDMTKDTLIIPGCWYSADMQIINNTDVAFEYWIEIVFDENADLTLANQLKLTVVSDKGTESKMLTEIDRKIGAAGDPIGVLAETESALFTIKVEFCDLANEVNNTAQEKSFEFDIVVHAVQVKTVPSA